MKCAEEGSWGSKRVGKVDISKRSKQGSDLFTGDVEVRKGCEECWETYEGQRSIMVGLYLNCVSIES